jgi:hypothetical protein
MASTGPSSTIHVVYGSSRLLYFSQMAANTPLTHSPLSGSVLPYSSCACTALGLSRTVLYARPSTATSAACSVSMMRDLPPPAGPVSMMPWRTRHVSCSCTTLATHAGWNTSLLSATTARIADSMDGYSRLGGGAHAGNRSASMHRNSGTSCATSLDRFMSRSVRYSSISSSAPTFSRLVAPAVRSTDRMLRSPKS